MKDIDVIKRTVEECRKEYQDNAYYYEMAEPHMERQWPTMIWAFDQRFRLLEGPRTGTRLRQKHSSNDKPRG